MAAKLEGGCACRAVRYRLGAEPFDTGWCHCRQCQRTSGAPALVFSTVPLDAFNVHQGADAMRTFRSTSFGRRSFCGTCGSLLTMQLDHQPETIDFAAASLDRPEAVTPGFHIFFADHVRWFDPQDGLPRFAAFRPDTRGLA